MGKTLVIRGANFAQVSVETIIQEPSNYIVLAGAGTSSNFNNGDYYISNTQYGKIYKKIDGKAVLADDINAGDFLKYGDFFFIFQTNTSNPRFIPYEYNLEIITDFISDGKAWIVNDNTVEKTAITGANNMLVELSAGETLIYNTVGGNTYPGLIVRNESNTITVADSRKIDDKHYEIMTYTAQSDVTVYLNTPNARASVFPFVCKKI